MTDRPRVFRSELGSVAVEYGIGLGQFQLVRIEDDARAFLARHRMPATPGALFVGEVLIPASEFGWIELVDPVTVPDPIRVPGTGSDHR